MDNILSEKYRPIRFEEVIGGEELDRLSNLTISPMELPNILLFGPQGVGKSTVAKIILDKLNPIDVLKFNGSDTTGVDNIRDRVYNFITSKSMNNDKPKIVWIEEADFLSISAWAALRGLIEQFVSNARFIVTLNYLHKIPEPIQSRFNLFEFKKPSDEQIFPRIKYICEQEKIIVEDDIIKTIISKARGDIRTIINNLQTLSSNPEKKITITELVKIEDLAVEVFNLLKDKKWTTIRYEIPNKYPDYNKLMVDLEEIFFNSDYDINIKAKVTEIISNGLFEMSFSFDQNICFSAVCSKIIKEL